MQKQIWLAPAKIIEDIKKACNTDKPLSIANIPYINPNGNTPICNGNSWMTPDLKCSNFVSI